MWHAVEPEEEDVVEYHDDRLAFMMILRAVLPEMLASLVTKRTSQSAWEAIKSRCIGVQRVRDTNGEQLRKDFDNIRFKDGESVNDNIAVLGGKISEPEIIKKMLHVAPEPLEQVAISIETMLDLDRISVEEVTGHLRNVEQRKKSIATTVDKQGWLLLTEEE
jgi:ABC-type branched-subunit amino acid transport system ATPase component